MVSLVKNREEKLVDCLFDIIRRIKAGELDSFAGILTGPKSTTSVIHILDTPRATQMLGQLEMFKLTLMGQIAGKEDE